MKTNRIPKRKERQLRQRLQKAGTARWLWSKLAPLTPAQIETVLGGAK